MSVETYQSQKLDGTTVVFDRPMRLVEWAHEARAAHELAVVLCQTAFAGAYKDNPGGATAAILKGAEVGLTPVTSLGAFDLINGVPAPKAITLRALAQSHGHRVWIESSSDMECVAKAVRRGETEVHESRWTIKRAQGLNLTVKDNWKKQPAAMLIARATSEVCRLVAADVILGIGYSAEELDDEEASTVTVKREPRVIGRAKKPEALEPSLDEKPTVEPQEIVVDATPEPEFDDVKSVAAQQVSETPPIQPADPITPAQLKMMGALMGELGLTDRTLALNYVNAIIGRTIGSRKEISKMEAGDVIKALVADAKARDEVQA